MPSRGTGWLVLIIVVALGSTTMTVLGRDDKKLSELLPLLWAPPVVLTVTAAWFLWRRGKLALGLVLLLGAASAVLAGMGGVGLDEARRNLVRAEADDERRQREREDSGLGYSGSMIVMKARSDVRENDPLLIGSVALAWAVVVVCGAVWFIRRRAAAPVGVAPAAGIVAPGAAR